MARENKTKYAVLGLLAKWPLSGYDIRKRIEEYVGKFWSESYGQIYPIAKELLAEGLVTMTVERSDGKPDRNVYAITDEGLEELKRWLAKAPDPHKERLEILLKLVCGSHMPVENNIRLVEGFRDEWRLRLATYAEIGETIAVKYEGDPELPYWKMTVSCGMHLGQAYIDWCDETLAKLREMAEEGAEA